MIDMIDRKIGMKELRTSPLLSDRRERFLANTWHITSASSGCTFAIGSREFTYLLLNWDTKDTTDTSATTVPMIGYDGIGYDRIRRTSPLSVRKRLPLLFRKNHGISFRAAIAFPCMGNVVNQRRYSTKRYKWGARDIAFPPQGGRLFSETMAAHA